MQSLRFTPALRLAFLSCLSIGLVRLLGGCGMEDPDSISVVVHVPMVPTDTKTLSVSATLDGKAAMQTLQITNSSQFPRFGVRLPLDKSGKLALSIDVFDMGNCKLGNAVASTPIGPPLQADVTATLTLLAQKDCTAPPPPTPPTPATCSQALFCWSNPLPQGNPIRGMFALSASSVWAVGDAGTVMYYDGQRWFTVESGVNENLNAVWASGLSDVFAVGEKGTIIHYNGSGFSNQSDPVSVTLHGVWGTSSNNVFSVGDNGKIVHYTNAWSEQTSGVNTTLYGVWGSGSGTSPMIAVGAGGVIRTFDGSNWGMTTSPTTQDLRGIYGTNETQAFAVGAGGTIISYNGAWSMSTSAQSVQLNGVWGSSSTNFWAVGSGGSRQHWNGATWSPTTGDSFNTNLNAATGSGTTVFGGGDNGQLLTYSGSWTSSTQGSQQQIRSIYGFGANNIWAVGDGGMAMRYDGTSWMPSNSGTVENLNGIWGSSGSDIWAVGNNKTLIHYDGTQWEPGGFDVSPLTNLQGVWGSSSMDVFIVGVSSSPQKNDVIHIIGASAFFDERQVTAPATVPPFYAISGTSSLSVWVGAQGNVFNVVENGSHAYGYTPYPVTGTVRGIWANGTDVYAVGDAGLLLRFNGSAFTQVGPGTTQDLYSVWGSSSTDIWVTGNNGTVLRFDGSNWTTPASGTSNALRSVWGLGAADVWAGGLGGTILHAVK